MRSSVSIQRSEVAVVRGAAVAQGLALVAVPTLSGVLTDPHGFALSQSAYGGLFVPQSILAIVFSLAGGMLTRRFGIKHVLLLGFAADAASMGLLAATSLLPAPGGAVYPALLVATACLGFGFAVVTPALNVLGGDFAPDAVDRAVLIVNALLGAASALAPVLLAVFVGLHVWWGLPLLACASMLALLIASSRLPFDVDAPAAAPAVKAASQRLPARFMLLAAFAILYGWCEQMNGSWASPYLMTHLHAPATFGLLAIALLWAVASAGRVAFALATKTLASTTVFRLLPFVLAAAFALLAVLPSSTPPLAGAAGVRARGTRAVGAAAARHQLLRTKHPDRVDLRHEHRLRDLPRGLRPRGIRCWPAAAARRRPSHFIRRVRGNRAGRRGARRRDRPSRGIGTRRRVGGSAGMSERYDVIIIGSGAGGGTLAHRLAPSGKRILLLERGGWLTREPENWDVWSVFVHNRYVSRDSWTERSGKTFQPQIHYFVGGATKMYGAALYRLRKEDFGAVRHHDGISPAWPLGYDEFEPYYTQAENLYAVHGARGEDPTEPPASAPYPHPAVSHEPRIQQLHDDLVRAGHQPFHSPCGILLDESNMPFSTCVRCQDCDGFPCAVLAKSDADVCAVRPALAHDNLTLRTGAFAKQLVTNAAGTVVTGVVVEHGGGTETLAADIIVVSCGAANTARLLLASANDRHPNGLANGSDQVGRNYVFHNSQAVLAISVEPNPTRYQKTLGLNDFYFGAPDADFPLGNIQMVGKSQGPMYRGEKPLLTKLAPEWALDKIAEHAVDFWLTTEDLPLPDNRVTLERDGSIRLSYTPTNGVPKDLLYAHLKALIGKLGMHPDVLVPRTLYMKSEVGVAGVAHQAGTARFGTDPATSVLDTHCKAHELDNLYVVDTSFFPSIGAVNPGLTAMANALRVGDHLLERLGAPAAKEHA